MGAQLLQVALSPGQPRPLLMLVIISVNKRDGELQRHQMLLVVLVVGLQSVVLKCAPLLLLQPPIAATAEEVVLRPAWEQPL